MAKRTGKHVASVARVAGWSGADLVTAVAIAYAESGWDDTARGGPNSNGTYDYGLWQINDIHKPTQTEKTNSVANGQRAYRIYKEAGNSFKPWATYNDGKYKRHLGLAQEAVKELSGMSLSELDDIAKTIAGIPGAAVDKVGDAAGAIPNPVAGVSQSIDKINGTIGKVVNNMVLIFIAVVCIVLGVFILSRGSVERMATRKVTKMLGGTTKKARPAPAPAQRTRVPATRPAPAAPKPVAAAKTAPVKAAVKKAPEAAKPGLSDAQKRAAIQALRERGNQLAPKVD